VSETTFLERFVLTFVILQRTSLPTWNSSDRLATLCLVTQYEGEATKINSYNSKCIINNYQHAKINKIVEKNKKYNVITEIKASTDAIKMLNRSRKQNSY